MAGILSCVTGHTGVLVGRWRSARLAVGLLAVGAAHAAAQTAPDSGSPIFVANSANLHLLSHIPLGRSRTVAGIAMEQEVSRPYVYVSRYEDPVTSPAGF